MFGQAPVPARQAPRNTCCRHKPTPSTHDNTKQQASKSTWNYRDTKHFATHMDPSCSLHKATIGWEPQKRWFQKKTQKCRNTPCLDKPVLGKAGP